MANDIAFYMDEHVHSAVTAGLRIRGVDVLTAQEAHMVGASDEEHLALAHSEGRVLFTQDADFLRLNAAGIRNSGIVYAPQHTEIGRIVRGLMLLYQALEPLDMADCVEFI